MGCHFVCSCRVGRRRGAAILLACAGFLAVAAPALAQDYTFSDDFETNSFGTNWPNSGRQGASIRNDISGAGQGTYAVYLNTGADRYITTLPLNMQGGGFTLAFDIRYIPSGGTVTAGNTGPFRDKMDDSNDDIFIEFSTDGSTWTNVDTFTYNDSRMNTTTAGGAWYSASSSLTSFTFGGFTYFRWSQVNSPNNNQDNWAIDNVSITYSTPEPGTWAMFGAAAGGLAVFVVRRRRRARAAA